MCAFNPRGDHVLYWNFLMHWINSQVERKGWGLHSHFCHLFNKLEKTFLSIVALYTLFCQHVPTWEKKLCFQHSVLISEHGEPSVPCIVGALFDVLSLKQPQTLLKYQFVPGIPISSRTQQSCSLNGVDRQKHVQAAGRRCKGRGLCGRLFPQGLVPCKVGCGGGASPLRRAGSLCGGQMSLKQSACVVSAYAEGSHGWSTKGWAFTFSVGVKLLM